MIRPHKYLNLDISVICISATILQLMHTERVLKHDELVRRLIDAFGQEANANVMNAINFTFLLGKLEYYQDIDSFEFVK